jgi:hypothetical protein
MIEINDIRIEATEFKGNKYLSIRRWYEKDGQTLPSKKGINLKPEEAKELLENIDEVYKIVEEITS